MIDKKYLAKKHEGMRWSVKGSLRQKAKTIKITLQTMAEHLDIVAERFYSGDITAVDEFLQLYCFDEKRPKENEVKTMSEKYIVESYVNESKETVYQIRHSTKTVPFIETFDGDFMELICRLLNEEEKRKSLPKINKRTKDFIIDYLEQRKKEHESNICGKSTDDYFKEYVEDYCDAIEIIKNLSEGE